MPEIWEPDRARSLIAHCRDADIIRLFAEENWILSDYREYLSFPESLEGEFELIRGLTMEQCEWIPRDLRKEGILVRTAVWNEVEDGVLRAPKRVPGHVGNQFSFWIHRGKVFADEPSPRWEKEEVDWRVQAFSNHDHPGIPGDVPDDLLAEHRFIGDLQADLTALFPNRKFVIEYDPGCTVTFYEPEEDAPIESETEFKIWVRGPSHPMLVEFEELIRSRAPQTFRDYTAPTCFECGGDKVLDEAESPEFVGAILARCQGCGKLYVGASRTIRYRVGAWQAE